MRSMKILVAAAGLTAALAGCSPAPEAPPGGDNAPPSTTGGTAATGAPATTPSAAAPVAASTPTVAAAPDAGFDKAKAQKGFDDVKKMGKSPVAGDVAATGKGAELYGTNCASCHGAAGMGDGPAGMTLNPKPRNLTVVAEYKFGHGELGLFRTIKYGIDGTGMAPWEGRMTDEQCWQVANFVRTLQK